MNVHDLPCHHPWAGENVRPPLSYPVLRDTVLSVMPVKSPRPTTTLPSPATTVNIFASDTPTPSSRHGPSTGTKDAAIGRHATAAAQHKQHSAH